MDQPDTSDVLRELLVRQGMTRGRLAGPVARGMKVRAATSDGAVSRVKADERGAKHRPTAPREGNADLGMLRLVSSSRSGRTQPRRVAPLGVRPFLVLVWSDGHLVTRRPSRAMR